MGIHQESLSFKHLAAELRQIDAIVQSSLHAVLAESHGVPDRFRGLYVSQEEALALAESAWKADQSQDAPISDETTETRLLKTFEAARLESQQIEQAAAQAAENGSKLLLRQLREYFGLTDFEYHAFLICLLPALDLRYERIYGFLQDDVTKKQASVQLILSLLATDTPELSRLQQINLFSATGTLIRYHLLRPVPLQSDWQEPRLSQLYEVPPALVSWLMGNYFPEKKWLRMVSLAQVERLLENDPNNQTADLDWKKILQNRPMLSLEGNDEELQDITAAKTARRYHMPLLQVDLNQLIGDDEFSLSALRLIIRDACLFDALPYLQNFDRMLDENGFVQSDILEEMSTFAGVFILGSRAGFRISGKGGRAVFTIHLDPPSSAERMAHWEHVLSEVGSFSPDFLSDLAGRFSLTSRQIDNAVFVAKNEALQNGLPVSNSKLFKAARQQSAHHLGQLAQKIEPRFRWENIVLPEEETRTLKDLVAMVRFRPLVLETWGVGDKLASSPGISALFAGEPGTGKTLAAQVIAAELELDLYRIDLSRVVSKYIGETEKNLDQIFNEAQNSNSILFFDEADAIFGKRSEVKDAHDRYANIEVGYLLQRIETYSGVTILATNLRTNLDDAFTRRLYFIVSFPFPDENQRLQIWRVLLPDGLPHEADIDWTFLARKYALSGGSIRNILVSGAFLAAQQGKKLCMDHLLQSARQEMQKAGRLIKEEDYIYTRD